jgi:peptide/nickel transport system substrate-binding protein
MTISRRDLLATGAGAAALASLEPNAAFAQGTPQRGGTLNSTLWPEPPGLVIGLWLNAPTLLAGTKMFEGLLTYDFELNPKPMLAERWEIAPDGKRYVFHLRRNATWHDGRPFTSDDVVFTCGEYLTQVHPRSRPVFQRTRVRALDPHTVEFTLENPFAPLIRNFDAIGAPIVPAHIYRGTEFRQNPANANPVGTGPFKFQEFRRGSHIHLVRNPNYWQAGKPHLDEIYYRFIPDAVGRSLAIEQSRADIATQDDIDRTDVRRLGALPHLEMTTKGWEWGSPISWLEMNVRKAPFNDKRFRQAVLYALNREFIRDAVFSGLAKVATGPIHSSNPFYDPNVMAYPHDPARAQALLDEMGLRRGAGGTRTSIKLLGLPYGEVWNRLNEYVRQALANVGIAVQIENTDVAGWGDRTRNWDFDMTIYFLTTLADPALGVSRSYATESIRQGVLFGNHSGYSNPQVDDLFARAARGTSDPERKQLYSQVQKILVEDAAVAWMVELQWATFINRRARNLVTNGLGPNDHFADAWLAR